jgi:hypothetical protein
MNRKLFLNCSLALALFAGGYWFGMDRSVQAAGNRVFELRTYTTNEGKLPDLQKRFREHTTKLFEKHGMTNIGYWVPEDKPLSENTLIYMLAYPSREDAKKSWDAFRNDPEWKKVSADSELNGKIVNHVDSKFLDPTDYSSIK